MSLTFNQLPVNFKSHLAPPGDVQNGAGGQIHTQLIISLMIKQTYQQLQRPNMEILNSILTMMWLVSLSPVFYEERRIVVDWF